MTPQASTYRIGLLIASIAYLASCVVFIFLSSSLDRFIYRISADSIIIPTVLGWMLFRRLNRQENILLALVTAAFIAEVANLIGALVFQTNIVTRYVFSLFEYFLITSFFAAVVERPTVRRLLRWSVLPFGIIWVIPIVEYFLFALPFNNTNPFVKIYTLTAEAILISVFALYAILELTNDKIEIIFSLSGFWVGLGVLTYFAGTLVLFVLGDDILTGMAASLWIIHAFNNTLLTLGYTIGFACRHRTS
jgi:hypothetical protein